VQTYPVAEPVSLRGTSAEAKPETKAQAVAEEKPKQPAPSRMAAGVVTSPVDWPAPRAPEAAPEKPKTVLASVPPRQIEPVETSPVVRPHAVAAAPRDIAPPRQIEPRHVERRPVERAPEPKPEKKVVHAAPPPVEPKKPRVIEQAKREERPAATRAPSRAPSPEIRTAYSAPLTSGAGLLSGAQPTVPIGSFASR
jgi:hypothetical protein